MKKEKRLRGHQGSKKGTDETLLGEEPIGKKESVTLDSKHKWKGIIKEKMRKGKNPTMDGASGRGSPYLIVRRNYWEEGQ